MGLCHQESRGPGLEKPSLKSWAEMEMEMRQPGRREKNEEHMA